MIILIDSRNISDLHCCLARGAKELMRRMEACGYPMGISSTYRDNEAQNALYAQGSTKPGNIVTNAKGGQSIHNYALAFDIFLNIKGLEYSDSAFFDLAGQIWEEMGGIWGGRWKGLVDKPHMEFTNGLKLEDLQKGMYPADTAIMKWEENTERGTSPMGEKRYNNTDELPLWAKPAIEMLMEKGLLAGDGSGFDLSHDMLRMFVINYRAGLYE